MNTQISFIRNASNIFSPVGTSNPLPIQVFTNIPSQGISTVVSLMSTTYSLPLTPGASSVILNSTVPGKYFIGNTYQALYKNIPGYFTAGVNTNANTDVIIPLNSSQPNILSFLSVVGSGSLTITETGLTSSFDPFSGSFAIVSTYNSASFGGNSDWGLSPMTSSREFITTGQLTRIRQSGLISYVRLTTNTPSKIGKLWIKIWRLNSYGKYDLVSTSDNIQPFLQSGSFTYPLPTPIVANEGDFIGYRLETNDLAFNYQVPSRVENYITTSYITNSTPTSSLMTIPSTNFDWNDAPKTNGTSWPIWVFMSSPIWVSIGDSIIAGHPGNYDFADSGMGPESTGSTIIANLCNLIGNQITYQNMGRGSETTTPISARFSRDVVALNPRFVLMNGGVNDIAADVTQSVFINNWISNLNLCVSSNIKPIVLSILPWTDGTTNQMQTRDIWNKALTALTSSYPNAVIIDASSYVGQFRAGGDPDNLWDINPLYAAGDGIHFNAAGYSKIARAIYDTLKTGSII